LLEAILKIELDEADIKVTGPFARIDGNKTYGLLW
jgi:hypothetical protein